MPGRIQKEKERKSCLRLFFFYCFFITATGEQAAEVCTYIRSLIRAQYGARIARSVTIQYGGSMKGSNAHELLSHEDIDGGLIGGASLDPKALMEIVHAANQE